MKKYIFSIILSLILLSNSAFAKEKLTILNAGSKTGSYAQQSTALAQDLPEFYEIDLKIPGDHCTAINMLQNIKGPVIMPWASDFEAIGRDGIGCATYSFEPKQVLRYNSDSMQICSLNFNSIDKEKHTIGHTVPKFVFERSIYAANNTMNVNLKPIPYDGSGAVILALINGEIDFSMTTPKHSKKILDQGGKCFWEFSDSKTTSLVPLQNVDPNNKRLSVGYDTVWLAINMDDSQIEEIKKIFYKIYNLKGSAINTYSQDGVLLNVGWNLESNLIKEKWEKSVSNMQEK